MSMNAKVRSTVLSRFVLTLSASSIAQLADLKPKASLTQAMPE